MTLISKSRSFSQGTTSFTTEKFIPCDNADGCRSRKNDFKHPAFNPRDPRELELRLDILRQFGALHRDLLAGIEMLERELVRLDLILADDQREARVELARRLQ